MPPDTAAFFTLMVHRGGPAGREEWKARLADGWDRHAPLLTARPWTALTAPCRTPCGFRCPRVVAALPDGSFMARCPEANEEAYPLDGADLGVMELDVAAVAERVARAVAGGGNVPGVHAATTDLPRVWRVGERPAPTFFLGETGAVLREETLRRIAAWPPGYRLLVPSLAAVPERDRQRLRERCALIPLDEALEEDGAGGWRMRGEWPDPPTATLTEQRPAAQVAENAPAIPKPLLAPEVERLMKLLARRGGHVLFFGETGTGKEYFARRLRRDSNKPFVAVNCASLRPERIQADLFGHEKGAFTGADKVRPGAIREAAGGIVFLDEIGNLPEECQVALLRFIESGEIAALGKSSRRGWTCALSRPPAGANGCFPTWSTASPNGLPSRLCANGAESFPS